MSGKRFVKYGLVLLSLFLLFIYMLENEASARVGGGRSMGSRGSRSYSAPSRSPSAMPSSPSGQSVSPSQPLGAPQTGGFLRSMGGGILGGMLGGMLFRSLGFGGGMGGVGGGIGLFEIILIGLILYGIWWFIKKKRQEAEATASPNYYREMSSPAPQQTSFTPASGQPQAASNVDTGISHIKQMDSYFDEQRFKDFCLDTFFKVQGAFANRDMSTVRKILTDEMYGIIQADADELRSGKKISRLENIAVRSVEATEVWQESGKDFITVLIYANLLDYTVDETTGQVVSGSKTEPVKFEEYWTFTRPVGNNPWQLSAITQA